MIRIVIFKTQFSILQSICNITNSQTFEALEFTGLNGNWKLDIGNYPWNAALAGGGNV